MLHDSKDMMMSQVEDANCVDAESRIYERKKKAFTVHSLFMSTSSALMLQDQNLISRNRVGHLFRIHIRKTLRKNKKANKNSYKCGHIIKKIILLNSVPNSCL